MGVGGPYFEFFSEDICEIDQNSQIVEFLDGPVVPVAAAKMCA